LRQAARQAVLISIKRERKGLPLPVPTRKRGEVAGAYPSACNSRRNIGDRDAAGSATSANGGSGSLRPFASGLKPA